MTLNLELKEDYENFSVKKIYISNYKETIYGFFKNII